MSRGLGQVENEVIVNLGLTQRRPVLLVDLVAALAHERRAVSRPDGGYSEACDCTGPCSLVTDALTSSVHRAVVRLGERRILTSELDHLGRKLLSLSTWPPLWRFGIGEGPVPVDPRLCPECGKRLAGRAVRGEF